MTSILGKGMLIQAIVKYNSFLKAAMECYISQSAISQQIKT